MYAIKKDVFMTNIIDMISENTLERENASYWLADRS